MGRCRFIRAALARPARPGRARNLGDKNGDKREGLLIGREGKGPTDRRRPAFNEKARLGVLFLRQLFIIHSSLFITPFITLFSRLSRRPKGRLQKMRPSLLVVANFAEKPPFSGRSFLRHKNFFWKIPAFFQKTHTFINRMLALFSLVYYNYFVCILPCGLIAA